MRQIRFLDESRKIRTGSWVDGTIRTGTRTVHPDEVTILPPTAGSKVVAVGGNYAEFFDDPTEIPEELILFVKPSNTFVGHEGTVSLPVADERYLYEAEFGVVIGRSCSGVTEADAMNYVAGYTCVNDITRDYDLELDRNVMFLKSFDDATPFGPVVASPDHVPDDATIELRQNGTVRQQSSIADLIRPVPEIIADISQRFTLEVGDVIATGSPSGIGPMHDGDTIEITVEGIGTLRHAVRNVSIEKQP